MCLIMAADLPHPTQAGEGDSDIFDALTVAMDLIAKASAERATEKLSKKLTVISNFVKAVSATAGLSSDPVVPLAH